MVAEVDHVRGQAVEVPPKLGAGDLDRLLLWPRREPIHQPGEHQQPEIVADAERDGNVVQVVGADPGVARFPPLVVLVLRELPSPQEGMPASLRRLRTT